MFQSINSATPISSEVFYCTRGLFLLVIATVFFFKKYPSEVTWEKLSWPIAAIMTLAPFLAYYHSPLNPYAAIIPASIFGGIGIVWSYLVCISGYRKLETRYIAGYVLCSFALASLIRIPIGLLPLEAALFVCAPFPILGIGMAIQASRQTEDGETISGNSFPDDPQTKGTPLSSLSSADTPLSSGGASTENLRGLIPVAIELAIYGIVLGVLRFGSETGENEWLAWIFHQLFRTLFPLFLLLWIFPRNRSVGISLLCQIALLFVITALLIVSLFSDTASPLAAAAATCARTTIIILLWLALALLTRQTRLHHYVVFGIGWSLYMLSLAFGLFLGETIGTTSIFTDSVILNLVYLLAVSTVFVLLLRGKGRHKPAAAAEDGFSPTESFALLDKRCEAVGIDYRLTKREVEVMQLIYKGRSKRHIAQQLLISEHTVRGYTKNLYSKLDIHSKQELLDLIGV